MNSFFRQHNHLAIIEKIISQSLCPNSSEKLFTKAKIYEKKNKNNIVFLLMLNFISKFETPPERT